MNIDEILPIVRGLSAEDACRLLDELRSSHPDLGTNAADPRPDGRIILLMDSVAKIAAGAEDIYWRGQESLQLDKGRIARLQQTVRQQREALDLLQPIVPLLVPLGQLVLPWMRRLMQFYEQEQRKRRRPKSGTIAIMRRVHDLRQQNIKWDVVHKRMQGTPGYRIGSSDSLRQRYCRFVKSTERPEW